MHSDHSGLFPTIANRSHHSWLRRSVSSHCRGRYVATYSALAEHLRLDTVMTDSVFRTSSLTRREFLGTATTAVALTGIESIHAKAESARARRFSPSDTPAFEL